MRRRWSALLGVGTAGLIGVAVVGTPAVASTGGTATARAADVTVGSLTIAASANSELLNVAVAALNGLTVSVGGAAQTDQATTPAEPTGMDHEELVSLQVPGVAPVVTLRTMLADTVRTVDGLDATSSVAVLDAQLGTIDLIDASAIASEAHITVDGAPSASASVASLSIGGNPFVVAPNVVINETISVDAADIVSLITATTGQSFGGLTLTSGFGEIFVTVQSVTSTGADSAHAVGLEVFVNVDLHVSFVLAPVPFRSSDAAGWRRPAGAVPTLELDIVGPLINLTLAETDVTRPAGIPTTTTTTTVPAATTTVPAVTSTVPGAATTVAPQLPQTGSASTPVLLWATLMLAAGAVVTALATRRR